MNVRRCLLALIPLALLVTRPTHGDIQGPNVEITMGILVRDTSCARASYALVDVCAFLRGDRTPQLYVTFPGARNVDRFVERNVRIRGTMEFTSCAAPVVRVTDIDYSALPSPPCPGICQPGDPPPCPQQGAAAVMIRTTSSG
jgi:hypothetical protein